MNRLSSFNKWIERKNLDHLRYLQSLLLMILILMLMMYLWLLAMLLGKNFDPLIIQNTIKDMLWGNGVGAIIGIGIGLVILLPKYIQAEWDLHVIVPYFLYSFLIALVVIQILSFVIFPNVGTIRKIATSIGIIIGGFISIIAYAGEIKREHQDPDPILVDE